MAALTSRPGDPTQRTAGHDNGRTDEMEVRLTAASLVVGGQAGHWHASQYSVLYD